MNGRSRWSLLALKEHGRVRDRGREALVGVVRANASVLATFSDAWTAPIRLKVVDPSGTKAPEQDDANLMPATPWKEPVPAAHGLVVRIGELAGHPAVFGAFRTSAPKSDGGEPFATIVLARLCSKGGTLQRQFRLTYTRDTNDVWGGFAVPLSALDAINPLPPSRYALFAFVGDESATMSVVQIP